MVRCSVPLLLNRDTSTRPIHSLNRMQLKSSRKKGSCREGSRAMLSNIAVQTDWVVLANRYRLIVLSLSPLSKTRTSCLGWRAICLCLFLRAVRRTSRCKMLANSSSLAPLPTPTLNTQPREGENKAQRVALGPYDLVCVKNSSTCL